MHDYELCSKGQDGIRFHASISFKDDRLFSITFYDHGPQWNWGASYFINGKWINVVNGRVNDMNTKHTPTPWNVSQFAKLGNALSAEDRAFIVRAVNAHDELLSAVKIAARFVTGVSDKGPCDEGQRRKLWDILDRAIAKAEGHTNVKAEGKNA